MRSRLAALMMFLAPAALASEHLACPDLAAAVQVATCPSEEELRYTYTGYCSADARMYGKDDNCVSYEAYRRLKNVALWESADGAFDAYVSCDLPAATLKGAKASGITVRKQGKLTQLICTYGEGIRFTFRTKGACKVTGSADCAADPAACQAECN